MLEQALVAHGSPTLARLKAGSLFAAPCPCAALTDELRRVNGVLRPRGLRLIVLRREPRRTLLYLYREQALAELLSHADAQALLSPCGYDAFSVPDALNTLRRRLNESPCFPHEIGVFLGYPLADVIGFIQRGGRDCLCSGCWKAYANEREAMRTFARLNKCRTIYARLFSEGYSLARLTVRT